MFSPSSELRMMPLSALLIAFMPNCLLHNSSLIIISWECRLTHTISQHNFCQKNTVLKLSVTVLYKLVLCRAHKKLQNTNLKWFWERIDLGWARNYHVGWCGGVGLDHLWAIKHLTKNNGSWARSWKNL